MCKLDQTKNYNMIWATYSCTIGFCVHAATTGPSGTTEPSAAAVATLVVSAAGGGGYSTGTSSWWPATAARAPAPGVRRTVRIERHPAEATSRCSRSSLAASKVCGSNLSHRNPHSPLLGQIFVG